VPTVSIPGRAHPVTEYRLEDVLEFTEYTLPNGHDCVDKKPSEDLSYYKKRFPKSSDRVVKNLHKMDESIINYDLIALTLEYINANMEDGAILVFLPGLMEITKTVEAIGNISSLNNKEVRKSEAIESLAAKNSTSNNFGNSSRAPSNQLSLHFTPSPPRCRRLKCTLFTARCPRPSK